jgi:hypothetical protein
MEKENWNRSLYKGWEGKNVAEVDLEWLAIQNKNLTDYSHIQQRLDVEVHTRWACDGRQDGHCPVTQLDSPVIAM